MQTLRVVNLAACYWMMASAKQPTVVALAGGSGAGKNYLAGVISDVFGSEHISFLSHDRYYKDQSHVSSEERSLLNFDHPDSLDSPLIITHIKDLRKGRAASAPVYNFTTHSRVGLQTVAPAPLVLVDGILLLAEPLLAEAFDIRIYVDAPADIRLLRRIRRDMAERGRSLESILFQYEATVRPMHETFVEPSKAHADMIVSGAAGASFRSLLKVLAGATGLTPRGGHMLQRDEL